MKKLILSLLGCGCMLAAQTARKRKRSSTARVRPFDYPAFTKWFEAYGQNDPIGPLQLSVHRLRRRTKTIAQPDRGLWRFRRADDRCIHGQGAGKNSAPARRRRRRGHHLQPAGNPKLKLDGDTLANIYLGNITKWNDPKIAALNPGVSLPDTADRPGPSLRRQRHELHLHRLSEQREPGLGGHGGQGHLGEMARGHRPGRQRQRRRRRPGQTTCPAPSATRNWPTPTRIKFPMPT